jgi:hypothetical protein
VVRWGGHSVLGEEVHLHSSANPATRTKPGHPYPRRRWGGCEGDEPQIAAASLSCLGQSTIPRQSSYVIAELAPAVA